MMDANFIKTYVGNKISYEITSRRIDGRPPMTDEEKEQLAVVETFKVLEDHFDISNLLEVLADLMEEDDEAAAEKFTDMRKLWKKALKGNPQALAKMFES